MSWSDAERKLLEEERQRRLRAEQRIAWEMELLRQEQISNYRVQQFLVAMKKAGNPGIRYKNPLDWLRKKGYWYYPGFAIAWVCTDGTYKCCEYGDTPQTSYVPCSSDHVVEMLLNILRSYNVPIPED